jgi:hypothetical protein
LDLLSIIATSALGLGLSLATYRLVARQFGWSMGAWHTESPLTPALIGLFCFLVAVLFAAARGVGTGGLAILVTGLLIAVLWTGLLRVASQISLFLAPIAALLLILGWSAARAAGV